MNLPRCLPAALPCMHEFTFLATLLSACTYPELCRAEQQHGICVSMQTRALQDAWTPQIKFGLANVLDASGV